MPDSRLHASPLPYSRTSRFAPPPTRWEVAGWWMGVAVVMIWCAVPFFLAKVGRLEPAIAGFMFGTIGRWALRNAMAATGRRMARHG